MDKQEYAAAVISLKNAIQISPELPEARFLLGTIYWRNKQYDYAEKELNRALRLNYPAHKVIPLLSQTYHKNNTDNELLRLDHKVAGLTVEQKVEVAFYKLQAYFRLNKTDDAQDLAEEISHYDTQSPFKRLAESFALSFTEKPEAALAQVETILEQSPNQSDALKLKAMLLLQQKEPQQAVQVYQQYTELHPEDAEAAMFQARLLTELNRTEEAEPIIDKLLAKYQNNMLLNQMKGVARFNAKDNINALLFTEKAISINPKNPASRLVAAYSAFLLGNCDVVNRHLSVIAEQIPANHKALKVLSICQLNLGLGIGASETLNSLDSNSPEDTGLFSMVGLKLVEQGEYEKAKAVLDSAPKDSLDALDLTRLGLLQLSLNEVSAVVTLELAHEQDPSLDATKTILATAYLNSGQFEQAIELADRWKSIDANDTQAYLVAGLAYFKEQDYGRAKQEFKQLLSIDPGNTKAQMLLIEVDVKSGNTPKAQSDLNALLAKHPDFVPGLLKLYLFAADKTDVLDVIKRIRKQVQAAPKNIDLTLALAQIQNAENMFAETISLLESVTDQKQKTNTYWNALGQAYLQLKQYRHASEHYQAWLTQQPNNRTAIIGNLMLMDQSGKYTEALTLTKKYLQKQPEDSEIQVLNTHFLIKTGDFKTANKRYQQLSAQMQALPFSKGLLGQLQMNDNDFSAALANILIAYNNTPSTHNVQLIYRCYYELGQIEESYQFLATHVKNNPKDFESLMQLASVQIYEDQDAALKNYELALKIEPDNVYALNNLAYLYLQKNRLDDAEQKAFRALELQPDQAYVLDTYGQVLIAKKQYQKAIPYFTRAVRDANVIEGIYLNYIEALFLTEQNELATRKIKQRTFTEPSSLERLALLQRKYTGS
jgi:putative PEP-CTERM system TPR-repeat lipoprotein